ncbi:Acg family FMN-binding oxidoreductase [Qipengyuania qiaonensis]|uniref:Twin-arginine translocation pathway signal protein n=1 Tax=Qipengyuania qiaonensis TaxID=2867240 RepID=A0ABS7J2Q5_9SPHN|nr:hypothetical protein [Qipengyuania qiaonensis]MBX7481615.1 hypothetical protein [Qipengyuania qiaonensis]
MDRRRFLRLAGGGVVLAAAGGAVGFVATRTPHAALAPWEMAGSQSDDPRIKALSYAILAPNPHNRQPWIADLRVPGEISLSADTARRLPHTDPFDRQITIGLGCFIELLAMAAAEDGYRLDVDLMPDGENGNRLGSERVARARFVKDDAARPDPLFAHVLARRSNKEPFDTARAISEAALQTMLESARELSWVGGTVEEAEITAWRALTSEALEIEIRTPRTYRESVELFRIGRREIEANPDGIDFSGPLFETLALAGQFDRETLLDPTSSAFRQGLDTVLANPASAMGFVWLVTPANNRASQIGAGRDWVRLNLAATGLGLGFQPLSQALQEYREMESLYRAVHERLAPEGGTVQMLTRIGYGPQVGPSPRWPVEARIIT